jgi:hypothetical protein
MKKLNVERDNNSERFEAGQVSQQIYNDCPELKHLVYIAPGVTPNEK